MENATLNKGEIQLPEGWSVYAGDAPTTRRIVESYVRALDDGYHPWTFLQELQQSYTVVNEEAGWVSVSRVVPGVSAHIHGAKWPGVERDVVRREFTRITRWLLEVASMLALVAPVPETNTGAKELLKDVGFIYTGFEPFRVVVDGKPVSTEYYALTVDAVRK